MAVSIAVEHVTKRFGNFTALQDVSFKIESGTFVTLLGPSGCGKTTLLRTIAGFLEPEQGIIRFDDKIMNDIPPNKRNTAMCFQSYALFPHKNVYENIAFGLKMHKIPEEEQKKRIRNAVEMVNLEGLEKRKPYELSGGQQQRVALARSIVVQPDVLLFDEPLSNLDAKLREKVRVDIRRIQQTLGITAIYVTHDQAEALALSDVIIAMKSGRVVQEASPRAIYDRPIDSFVADFIGVANISIAKCTQNNNGLCWVETQYGKIKVCNSQIAVEQECNICIRPEDLRLVPSDYVCTDKENIIVGRIQHAVYMGNALDLFVDVNGKTLRASVSKNHNVRDNAEVHFCIDADSVIVMGD